jgi:hypothetical protein
VRLFGSYRTSCSYVRSTRSDREECSIPNCLFTHYRMKDLVNANLGQTPDVICGPCSLRSIPLLNFRYSLAVLDRPGVHPNDFARRHRSDIQPGLFNSCTDNPRLAVQDSVPICRRLKIGLIHERTESGHFSPTMLPSLHELAGAWGVAYGSTSIQ